MITKIKRLKNIGKFYDFSTKGSGLDWHKNTFLFAPNAYGKSTLVNVCRSLKDNDSKLIRARKTLGSIESPEAVFILDGVNHIFNGTIWNKSCSDIQIFDVPFVHDNILTDEIEHEHRKNMHKIIIGAAGVKLAEELSTYKTKEKNKRQQFVNLHSEFNKAKFVHHTLDTFLAIPTTEESAVLSRIESLEKNIKSKETESQVRALGLPGPITAPVFDLAATMTLAAKKLATAHEEAEKRVLAHIEKNIANKSRAKQFIRIGLDLLQADCPFCGQDLKTAIDLLGAYREFFDEAFRTFQVELSQAMSKLDRWNIENELTGLTSSHNANTAKVRQWDPYIGAEMLPDASLFVEKARKILTVSRTKVLAELEKKQKDPNSDCDLSQFYVLVSELKALSESVKHTTRP